MANHPDKIFIVDDNDYCRNLYHQHLTNLGYTDIQTFNNGQDCLNELSENPKIIFLDYLMPPINGLDVLIKIKRVDPNIFILLLSAQDNMQVAIDALKYGALDYVIKGENDLDKITKNMIKIKNLEKMMFEKTRHKKSLLRKSFFNL